MKPGYQADLAYIHDVGFSGFVCDAAPWLLQRLRSNGICGGLVVDLGCGSGRWAAALLRAGYAVEGIDLSPAMIALAKKHAPRAKFRAASLLSARIPSCAAVTAIGECVNYAFDRSNSGASLKKFFRRVHEALQPGGMFIFDAAGPGIAAGGPLRRWMEGKDWAILLELTEQPRRHTCLRRMTIFRRVKGHYRRSEEAHPMRLCSRDVLVRLLRDIGFDVEVVPGYGKPFRRPSLAGFVCKKVG
jgi:SAM-dependent methyltransferase